MTHTYIKEKADLNFTEFFQNLEKTEVISADTEATGLDPFTAEWIVLQVKLKDTIYLFDARTLDRKILSHIVALINSSGKTVIFHNAKYDLKIIKLGTGILLSHTYDTMIVESLLDRGLSENRPFYSLEDLAEKYCQVSLDKQVRESFIDFKGALTVEQLAYSAEDVMYLEHIYNVQKAEMSRKGMEKILDIEMTLIPVITAMELEGVHLDKEAWLKLEQDAKESLEPCRLKILTFITSKIDYSKYKNCLELATDLSIPVRTKKDRLTLESISDTQAVNGWLFNTINIGSHAQLKAVLNKVFELNVESTNEKVLKDIPKTDIVDSILEFRGINKNITTYGSAFLNYIHPVTRRIHSEFIQNGTVSGRMSSADPDLQNIPAKNTYRNAFTAESGNLLLAWDYSQQEYRLAGSTSKDPVICNAYLLGKDMHTSTAAIIFGKDIAEVTKEERSFGKTINFAVLYGSTAYGLSFNLKIDTGKAEEFLDKFYSGYPRLKMFKAAFEDAVWSSKTSSTLLGRKRYWDDKILFADYREARKYESRVKREGFNHLIQGTGADVTKLAMIKMAKENPFKDDFKLIMQVHDEIVAEVKEGIAKEAEEFGKKCMIDVFTPFLGNIPAAVDSHIGLCWNK